MENVFRTPEAVLVDDAEVAKVAPFFVTSIRKLCLLYIATMGSYLFYWMYKQWASQRQSMGKRIWPLGRTLFMVFYTHSLCSLIARRLAERNLGTWHYKGLATVFVILGLSSSAMQYLGSPSSLVDVLFVPLAFNGLLLVPLIAIQRYANVASLDPAGSENSAISFGNIFWVLLGALMWTSMLYGAWLISRAA
jgi:hypothetical protein